MGARSRSGKSSKAAAKAKAESKADAQKEKQNVPQLSLWQKFRTRGALSEPDDALKTAYWIRQTMGISLGILFGILRLTGAPTILSFLVLSFLLPPAFLTNYHDIDLEEVAKVGAVQTEGLFPSFALFLLSWIVTYTLFLPART